MKKLDFKNGPLIMGILNITPDSFSGDGLLLSPDTIAKAVSQAGFMLEEGAALLDIGGESSRPGSTPISAEEEIHRTVPVIEALRRQHGTAPLISIDTTKAEVAEAGLQAGADIINDISALTHDPAMEAVAARHGCPVILMHNRATPGMLQADERKGSAYAAPVYTDIIEDVKRDLMLAVERARNAGIADTNIILDPGIGFGKNATQNRALIQHIGAMKGLGFPVLLGPSRKSFIGETLDLPVDERLEGTAACIAIGVFQGADIVRVHDVKFMTRVARMAAAIKNA